MNPQFLICISQFFTTDLFSTAVSLIFSGLHVIPYAKLAIFDTIGCDKRSVPSYFQIHYKAFGCEKDNVAGDVEGEEDEGKRSVIIQLLEV